MTQLILKRPHEEDLLLPVDKSLITVGRAMDNDISIDVTNISRHHLRIENRNNQFYVKDLNSTNGTYVNAKKITKTTLLQNLDIISIGTISICIMDDQLDSRSMEAPVTMSPLSDSLSGTNMTFCYLEVIHPPNLCNKYKVEKTHIVLGREKECDIMLRDITCAKRHAQIIYTGKEFKIQDLGWNGTVVNGIATKEHTLHENDIIELGKIKIRFLPAVQKSTNPSKNTYEPDPDPTTKAMRRPPQSNTFDQNQFMINQKMDKPVLDPFLESLGKSKIIHLNTSENKNRKEIDTRSSDGNRNYAKQDIDKPVKEIKIELVSSMASDIFHHSNCKLAREIPVRKRVIFKSMEEAIQSGRHACNSCKPGIDKRKAEDMLKKLFKDVESLKQQAEKMVNLLEEKGNSDTDI